MPAKNKLRFPIDGVTKFDPSSFGNVRMWFRADTAVFTDTGATTPATKTGDNVKIWINQVAEQDFKQSGASAVPTLQLNAINGWPALKFDGSTTFLKSPGNVQVNYPHSTFIVGTWDRQGALQTRSMFALGGVGNTGTAWVYGMTDLGDGLGARLRFNNKDGGSSYYIGTGFALQRKQPFLLSVQEKGDGADTVYINGQLTIPVTGTSPTTSNQTGFQYLGQDGSGAGTAFWAGLIAEILVFDRPSNLTATQFQQVNAYFLYKYGFYGAGPSIFPKPSNITSAH